MAQSSLPSTEPTVIEKVVAFVDERIGLKQMQAKMLTGMPAGVAAEWREVDRVERGGFVEYRAAGEAPAAPASGPAVTSGAASATPWVAWGLAAPDATSPPLDLMEEGADGEG